MPPDPQSGIISLRDAIDRYFQLALYLLVLAGFATLASAGGLDLATMLLVGAAMAARGYMLAKRRSLIISERWTTPLTIAYFIFFALDFSLISRSFLASTVHLALFGVVVRMFSLRRERDHITLAILAFLMVLASAVLTVDSVFLFCFGAFMLMAIATFVLMEMRRSGRAASIQAKHTMDAHEHRHLAFSLVRVAPLLMLMILIAAGGIFFLLPRVSAGYMGAYSFGTDLSTGFSDRVQLGQIGQIQQSNAVVMHVQVEGDSQGRYNLRLRGVALRDFDGNTWSNPREQFMLQRQWDNTFRIPFPGSGKATLAKGNMRAGRLIRYRVLMEPIGTNVFFLAPWARSVRGDYRLLPVDQGLAVYDLDGRHPVNRYEAESDIATPSAPELREAGKNYPPDLSESYLRLPALDPRIPGLAAQVASSAPNNFDKATLLENYLRTHFGYTLQLPPSTVSDPLANFLFERKRGHCEYFASAMAVMLRTLGIPSRVVNGFRTDEFNDLTGNYVVRAKDAHSWVEAYFPEYGWQTFDPTPGGTAGIPQGWDRIGLYLDAASSFWREWVISYDASHQYVLSHEAIRGTRGLWEEMRSQVRGRYGAMLNWAKRKQQRVERSPGRWGVVGSGAALALFLLFNAKRIARMVHEKRLQWRPEQSPEQAASLWYARMARILGRRGLSKLEAQTPCEFLNSVQDERLHNRVATFTAAYEAARFGKSAEDARQLPELYHKVESATRAQG